VSRTLIGALLALVFLLWSSPSFAAYESFRLGPGFVPDPATGSGTAGGADNAARYGTTPDGPCVGSIDTTPDHRLTLTGNFSYLRVRVTSPGDTSLVIKGPAGILRCSDDDIGLDPMIEGSWRAGSYEIYVGSLEARGQRYTISISEIRSSQPPGRVDYESLTLSPGFLPDPQILSGRSGGTNDASRFGVTPDGPCVGQIDSRPDHEITLTSSFHYLELRVESSQDTSLVVHGPQETRCNDDHYGLNPSIRGA